MLTPAEIERASMAMDVPMRQLEARIMSDIVRRVKAVGEITSAADWQINRLHELGMSRQEIQSAISVALGMSDKDADKLFREVMQKDYIRSKALYEATGTEFIPFEKNLGLQQLLGATVAQTNSTLKNITQSLGFAQRNDDGKLVFTPLAGYYQKTLDGAVLDIASGAFDYNTVLKRIVREMTNSGLRTVDYASGWSNRIDVAARRAVMTGLSQLTAKVNEQNAEQLDTEWFEISWHSGARPSHWWGGRWYRKDQLVSICGLGDVRGLCGANCYHDYSPVIPGVSEPTYSPEELEELNRKEQEPVEYNGKQYTKYEALQRQRRLETTMRAQRQEMQLLKEGGADEDDLINCRARYMGTSQEYTAFSKAMGLPQQRERVTVDGLGNIMQGKYTGGSGKPSPVKVPPVGAKVTDKVTAEERKELLSRDKVDIRDNAVFNEQAVSHSNNDYSINTKDINTKEYTDKYSGVGKNHVVDNSVKNEAISILNHRDGTPYEDLSLINYKTGKVEVSIRKPDVEHGVMPNEEYKRFLSETKEEVIALHNHPSSVRPSISDILTTMGYDRKKGEIVHSCIKKSVVSCHNGKVYIIDNVKHERTLAQALDKEYKNVYNYIKAANPTSKNIESYAARKAMDAVLKLNEEISAFSMKEL